MIICPVDRKQGRDFSAIPMQTILLETTFKKESLAELQESCRIFQEFFLFN